MQFLKNAINFNAGTLKENCHVNGPFLFHTVGAVGLLTHVRITTEQVIDMLGLDTDDIHPFCAFTWHATNTMDS